MTTRQTPWVELALTPYASSSTLIVGALSATPVIGPVKLVEGSPPDRLSGSALISEASRLTATIHDPARSAALASRMQPGAAVELRLSGSRLARWRGELTKARRDEYGVWHCEWASAYRRLVGATGPDIPAGADARTPRQMLDALAAAAGLPAAAIAGTGAAGRMQRIAIPQGRDGLEQTAWYGDALILDESWRAGGQRVRMAQRTATVSAASTRITDLPAYAGRDTSAVLVPPAEELHDPWGVLNHGELELTISALQGFRLETGSGEDSQISMTDLSMGTHSHTFSGSGSGSNAGGAVNISISGDTGATEVKASPADVEVSAVELVLRVDQSQAILVDRQHTFTGERRASVQRYGRRSLSRPLRMALTVTGRSWAELDAATPGFAGQALAALPTDADQQAYQDIIEAALRDDPSPVYRLDHDTTQGSAAAAALVQRRVGWRERLALAALPGLHPMRVARLETTWERDGWARQQAWYVVP